MRIPRGRIFNYYTHVYIFVYTLVLFPNISKMIASRYNADKLVHNIEYEHQIDENQQ